MCHLQGKECKQNYVGNENKIFMGSFFRSVCDFPTEIDNLENLLSKAEELQSVRQRLSAEMADHSGMIRTLVVRAEDSRLMMDM